MAASLKRLNFNAIFHHVAVHRGPAAVQPDCVSTRNWRTETVPGTPLLHGRNISSGAKTRAFNRVMKTFPDPVARVADASPLPPVMELATMPNYRLWHKVLTGFCGEQLEDRFVPPAEWASTYAEFGKKMSPQMLAGFYGAMMSMSCSFRLFELGDSLVAHFHAAKIPVNVTVASRYIKLCGRSGAPDSERKILKSYAELKRVCPMDVYDSGTAENIISGLYRTSKWEDCIKLMDTMDFSGRAGPVSISYVIAAAFTHDNASLGLRLLKRLRDRFLTPADKALAAWFTWSKKQGYATVMEMLTFVRDAEWYLPFETVKQLREWMESEQCDSWIGKFTSVSPKGECNGCQGYLEPITVNKDEFGRLRDSFIKSVIEGTDVFLHTNPKELIRYRDFIEKNAPFDVVVDGLNVAYHQNAGNHNSRMLAQRLRVVIEHLLQKRDKKILVLGRVHMLQTWNRDEMNRISNSAFCFFAENMSQDDPFVLYAALYSGLGCAFLSADLMRDHRFKLSLNDHELRKTFMKWQRTHQMELMKVHQNGVVRIKAPMKYSPVLQWTDSSIHVPYSSGLPVSLHEVPSTWLCLAKAKKQYHEQQPESM